jgi:hypothetical protein
MSTIKHNDIEIPADDPFKNCKLDRAKYALVLSSIIQSYRSGFVLSINNKWGDGKTTFVKMWQQQLQNDDFKTLYFNAWQNDLESNPLIAILAELKTLFEKKDEQKFSKLLKFGAGVAKNIIPAMSKQLAKKYLGNDTVAELAEGVAKSVTDLFKEEVESYIKRKKSMEDFRTALADITPSPNDKPIIFIIDELDRCRPTIAVEILEQIKHLFSVPGIVFVLSIDKIQLGNAVKGVYGSESMDVDEYLRRFIDLEFSLPEPDPTQFVNYLYSYFQFGNFFASKSRLQYREIQRDGNQFSEFAVSLFSSNSLSLRQQEKLMGHARLALMSFKQTEYVFPEAYLFLIFLRSHRPKEYLAILSLQYTLQEFLNFLEEIIPRSIGDENEHSLWFIEAILLSFYYNAYSDKHREAKLFEQKRVYNAEGFQLNLRNQAEEKSSYIASCFEQFSRMSIERVSITYLTERINLLKEILLDT